VRTRIHARYDWWETHQTHRLTLLLGGQAIRDGLDLSEEVGQDIGGDPVSHRAAAYQERPRGQRAGREFGLDLADGGQHVELENGHVVGVRLGAEHLAECPAVECNRCNRPATDGRLQHRAWKFVLLLSLSLRVLF
jgi:hypothetical protein